MKQWYMMYTYYYVLIGKDLLPAWPKTQTENSVLHSMLGLLAWDIFATVP